MRIDEKQIPRRAEALLVMTIRQEKRQQAKDNRGRGGQNRAASGRDDSYWG
jgi:hypothetical protein